MTGVQTCALPIFWACLNNLPALLSLVIVPMLWVIGWQVYEFNPFWIPWAVFSYTQHDVWLMRWLAGLSGSGELVTLLILFYNLFWALWGFPHKKLAIKELTLIAILPVLLIFSQLVPAPSQSSTAFPLPIHVVQGNLDIGHIRSETQAVDSARKAYLKPLSGQRYKPGTLLVLPEEGSLPGWVDERHPLDNPQMAAWMTLARQKRIHILTGLSSQTITLHRVDGVVQEIGRAHV